MASVPDSQNAKPSIKSVDDTVSKLLSMVPNYANWDPTKANPNDEKESPPLHAFRIKTDLKAFFTDPIPDIMLAPEVDNFLVSHVIIIGPEKTPYEGGFFYFYIKLPYDYPISPPKLKLMTTGQNTVRFNPNLYSNGKVCLSILNTWRGPQWNPGSTLYSVLLSIQSIMNEEPFHNEPGYEATEDKRFYTQVKQYNDIIRHETIRVAVIGMIEDDFDSKNMPAPLKCYIRQYFNTKISHYDKVIEANMHLDGLPMIDPLGGKRGLFQYKALKVKMEKLKQKCLSDQKSNNVDDATN